MSRRAEARPVNPRISVILLTGLIGAGPGLLTALVAVVLYAVAHFLHRKETRSSTE
jgi:hypothetical protein